MSLRCPCRPEVAERHSGYQVGGTSPFGLKKPLPVHVEDSVLGLDTAYVNGGRRGYLVGIEPSLLVRLLGARSVRCANQPESAPPGPSRSSR